MPYIKTTVSFCYNVAVYQHAVNGFLSSQSSNILRWCQEVQLHIYVKHYAINFSTKCDDDLEGSENAFTQSIQHF